MSGLRNEAAEAHGLGRHVAVPAELDVHAAVVADLPQGRENRREIHRPLAEHEVLVDAADHVLDVDVDDPRTPAPEVIGDRTVLDAMDVPQVDGQLEERMRDPLVELVEARERVDEHARARARRRSACEAASARSSTGCKALDQAVAWPGPR